MRILPEKLIPSIVLLLASALGYSTTQAAAFPAQFDPRRMSADEGWLFTGTTAESAMGGVAQGIGDINGDGYTDFIIGTGPYTESPAHYLVYGNPAGYDTVLPARGSDAGGRVYLGGLLRFVRLGDFNGDGFDDWLYQPVSTTSYPPDVPLDHLDAYIVLGQADSYGVSFDVGSTDTIRLLGTFPVDSNYTSRVAPPGGCQR